MTHEEVFAYNKHVPKLRHMVLPSRKHKNRRTSPSDFIRIIIPRAASFSKAFLRAFDVNLFGVYRINKTFLPLVKKGGRIIITTSELAPLSPLPFTGLYAITKSALDKYAYSLRMEVQLLGIKVSVLRPGAVKTDMLGVSTAALDKFVDNTQLYSCNATRFKNIVNNVEARNIPPKKIAKKTQKILNAKNPKQVYAINRNPLLLLLNLLPKRFATWIIKKILN